MSCCGSSLWRLGRCGGIGLAVLLGASVARAETPWIYSASVITEVEHDSNPLMSPNNPGSVIRERVSPQLNARYAGGQDEFEAWLGVWAEHSNRPDLSANRADPHARVEWRHTTPLSAWSVYATAERRAYRSLDVEERAPAAVDGTRTLESIGGRWSRSIGENRSVSADLHHDNVSYTAGAAADYRLTAGSAQFSSAIDERSSWFAQVNGQAFDADPIPGTAQATGSSSNSEGMSLGYRRSVSPNLDVEGSAGAVRFGGTNAGTSWQGSAKATYSLDRLQLSAEASRRSAPSPLNATLGLDTVLRLQAQYAVDDKTSLAAEASRSRLQAGQDSTWTQLALTLTRELSPAWRLGLRMAARVRDDATGRAHGTLLAITLTYTLPDL